MYIYIYTIYLQKLLTFATAFSCRIFFDFRWIWEPFWEPKSFENQTKIDSKKCIIFNIDFNRFFFDFGAQDGPKMAPRCCQDEPKWAPRCSFKSNIITEGAQDPSRLRFSSIFDPSQAVCFMFFLMYLMQFYIRNC